MSYWIALFLELVCPSFIICVIYLGRVYCCNKFLLFQMLGLKGSRYAPASNIFGKFFDVNIFILKNVIP